MRPTTKYAEGKLGLHPLRKDICVTSYDGDFCCGGPANLPHPGLHIQGVGHVCLPLQPFAVHAIKGVASPAPFGKGEETLVDLAVRNSLQVRPWLDFICPLKCSSAAKLYPILT